MLREICGDSALWNVIFVTSMWDEVSSEVGESREKELSTRFFKSAIDKGAQMVRHHNTAQSAHDVIRLIMKNRPVVLQIQRELVNEQKDIGNTSAGKAVNEKLGQQMKKHQAEMEEVRKEMGQALREGDEETKLELEEERRRLQKQINSIEKVSGEMASNYAAEKRRMEAKMREMERGAKGGRQGVEDLPVGSLPSQGGAHSRSPQPDIEIVYAPVHPLTYQNTENHHRVMGATGSGKSSVGWVGCRHTDRKLTLDFSLSISQAARTYGLGWVWNPVQPRFNSRTSLPSMKEM